MNVRLLAVATIVMLSSLLASCQTLGLSRNTGSEAEIGSAAQMGGVLFRAMEEHVRSQGFNLREIPHQTAYVDLNNDDTVDVILMLNGPEWCIGESCTVMVFEGMATGARMLAELTLISSPIAVGGINADGWRDLYVTLPGSAGKSTVAKIIHNGKSYPEDIGEWAFIKGKSLPGRAVLVGGGVSGTELAGFDRLLAMLKRNKPEAVEVVEAAPKKSISTSARFYGRYSWGPGEAYFRPCGGSSVHWVTASDNVESELDKLYRNIAQQQFDDVYLEMKAQSKPIPKEGPASFYEGVLEVDEIIRMDAVDEDTCSQAPTE